MKILARLSRVIQAGVFALCLSSFVSVAHASDHGGGPAGPEPLKFTVNVASASSVGRYLQVEMVFETVKPEVAQTIASLKPKVQHAIILLLAGENAETLRGRKGKEELMAKIIDAVNKVIDENEKTGVKEVLFTSFIIQ
jgi:flagellar FliL protein